MSQGAKEYLAESLECQECLVLRKPHFVMRSLKGRLVEPCSWIAPVAMSPVVWSKLPEELLERCVAMLPVGSRQRFAGVAKRWKSLLRSPEFQLLCNAVESRSWAPICSLEYHRGSASPFDLLWTSCRLPTAVSIRTTRFSEAHRLEFRKGFPDKFLRPDDEWPRIGEWWILQNGLVFMFNRERATDLCVMNPMTQQWLELPPHFDATDEHHHFSRAQVKLLPAGQFELIIVSGRTPTLSIYSSQDAKWSRVILEGGAGLGQDLWANVDDDAQHPGHGWPQYVSSKGLLFLAVGDDRNHKMLGLRVYNQDDGKLVRQLYGHSNPPFVRRILEHRGRLFVLDDHCCLDNSIWELDLDTFVWTTVSSVSESLQLQLRRIWRPVEAHRDHCFPLLDAVFVETKLCLTFGTYANHIREFISTHIVVYNLEDDTWSFVCPVLMKLRPMAGVYHMFSPTLEF